MTIYYRTTDGALRDLTAEQYAALADSKKATLRLWIVDAKPTPSATQVLVDGGIVVGDTEAHQTWTLRDKTQAELDADAAAAARATDIEQIKAVLTALKNGTGTSAERLTRLERVVFRLAKDLLL